MGGPAFIDGKYHEETDNFQEIEFVLDGVTYYSPENYFQCQKATNKEDFEMIRKSGTGGDCWSAAQRIKLRKDWEAVKVDVMYEGNRAKFEQHPLMTKKLTSTKGSIDFGGSTSFWNKWNGLIMERLRAEFRDDGKEDQETAEKIKKAMEQYKKDNTK